MRAPMSDAKSRPSAGARGATVMEIVVALAVMSLVMLAIFAAFKTALGSWRVTHQFTSEQQASRSLLEWLSRRIRLAGVGYTEAPGSPAVAIGGANRIVFRADTDGNGSAECHDIYLRDGVVYDRVGDASCASGTEQPLTPAREAGRLEVTSLTFSYYNASTVSPTHRLSVPLSDPDRYLVRRIEIIVGIRGQHPNQQPFMLSTQAVIRRDR